MNFGLIIFFVLRIPLKYDCLGEMTFWASGGDPGFQRTPIQIFGESQFYNASLWLGLLLKCDYLEKMYFEHVFGIMDSSERKNNFPVNLS